MSAEMKRTLLSTWLQRLNDSADTPFLNWLDPKYPKRSPQPWTYAQLSQEICQFISLLQENGIQPGDRTLILAENSPQWQTFSLASQTLRCEPAALFATLKSAQVIDIIKRVKPNAIFVSSQEQWNKIKPYQEEISHLKVIFGLDNKMKVQSTATYISYQQVSEQEPCSVAVFTELVQQVREDDPFILIFTSGTTGHQKGVQISQRAFYHTSVVGTETVKGLPQENILMFLPFAHIAGQCQFGTAIFENLPLLLCARREDIPRGFANHPVSTLFVPYFYQKIFNKVMAGIDKMPLPVRILLKQSVQATIRLGLEQGGIIDSIKAKPAQTLIRNKLKAIFGRNMQLLATAAAPISPEVVGFFRGLGFDMLNYYGMSETTGCIAFESRHQRTFKIGSVGKPCAGNKVKIAKDGEILFKGATLMTGYLEKADEVDCFTKDGYFKTGDTGYLDDDGYLFITGRKKSILILDTGKNVGAEAVETRLMGTLPIEAAVALGSQQKFVTGAVFIEAEEYEKIMAQLKPDESIENYCLKKVRAGFKDVASYERPKKLLVIKGTPADYPEILTPTLKIKRAKFEEHFKNEILKIYQ